MIATIEKLGNMIQENQDHILKLTKLLNTQTDLIIKHTQEIADLKERVSAAESDARTALYK